MSMELVIDKSIKINTSAAKVWRVLTERQYTDKIAAEFSPGMHEESDWNLGSPVFWIDKDGKCGWLKDRCGLSWQIVPAYIGELISGADPEKSKRVMSALLKMKKIDIETLKSV